MNQAPDPNGKPGDVDLAQVRLFQDAAPGAWVPSPPQRPAASPEPPPAPAQRPRHAHPGPQAPGVARRPGVASAAAPAPPAGIPAAPLPAGRHTVGERLDVDWQQVSVLRTRVAELLQARLTPETSPADQRAIGRELVVQVLREHARNAYAGDHAAWSPALEARYRDALFDSIFGYGRLQPLLDDPDVENIEIYGYDRVRLVYPDGRRVDADPVADSDSDLLMNLQLIAAHAESGARPFSYPEPSLTMLLGERHRLHAIAYNLSPRPLVTIRQHKHIDATLAMMVDLGMVDEGVASFLEHAVRAHKSIVVAGEQSSGKTTFMRALADAVPKQERIGTIEAAFELLLHTLPEQYPNVAPMQARAGGGEPDPVTGQVAGARTVSDLLVQAFTMNLDRILVGEVKEDIELVSMLHAMTASNGSLSTVHAKSGKHALLRLITLATDRRGDHVSAAHRVADNIDLIVFCDRFDNRWRGGTVGRRIGEVLEVLRGEGDHHATTKPLFVADHDGPALWRGHPTFLSDLERVGYQPQHWGHTP